MSTFDLSKQSYDIKPELIFRKILEEWDRDGFKFIGIDNDDESVVIAKARIDHELKSPIVNYKNSKNLEVKKDGEFQLKLDFD